MIHCLSACLEESVALDNGSIRIRLSYLTDLNEFISMFPDKINQIPFYMAIFCFYGTDHKFFIF